MQQSRLNCHTSRTQNGIDLSRRRYNQHGDERRKQLLPQLHCVACGELEVVIPLTFSNTWNSDMTMSNCRLTKHHKKEYKTLTSIMTQERLL